MIEIRSYHRVFDLERRVYRIDRLRLAPGGVPVRGIVYWLVLLGAAFAVNRLPLVDFLCGAFPWYLRDLAMPVVAATLLAMIRVEGRVFHQAALALMRHLLSPRHLSRFQRCSRPGKLWLPGPILVLPDGGESRLRRLRYTGPGTVLVGPEHRRSEPRRWPWSPHGGLILRAGGGRARPGRRTVIVLESGVRLTVR